MEAKKQHFLTPPGFIEELLNLISHHPWLLNKRSELSNLFQICQTEDHAHLLSYILYKFKYLDGNKTEQSLAQIAKQICEVWKLSSNDTCVSCRDLEGRTDSSAALQQMIKNQFGVYGAWRSSRNFRADLKGVISDRRIKNLVIVDDFSGTGKSLLKIAQWISDYAQTIGRDKINFYAAFIAVQKSTTEINPSGLIEGIFYTIELDKVISDSNDIDINSSKKLISELSEIYGGIGKKTQLGYGASEAAFSVQNLNTPNNVFPIFWKNSPNRIPLFPRMEK